MPTTRGSCLAGSANRAVSGATASQPTKDSISVDAACPIACQPCGANGVQLAACEAGADPATATITTTSSSATSTSCAPAEVRRPPAASASTAISSAAAISARSGRPPPVSSVT